MKKIDCIIADDEALARGILEEYIHRVEKLRLLAVCADGRQVIDILRHQPADLLFLDIKMPKLSGMELLRTVPQLPPVILTTAYRDFALEGYEFNTIDYLLKPFSFERFGKSIDKFERLAAMPGFLDVRSEKKMTRIPLQNILYIEGLKDYVRIHTTARPVITHETLTRLEAALPPAGFLRVHRSYIVSLTRITAWSAGQIRVGPITIPIGDSYRAKVLMTLSA